MGYATYYGGARCAQPGQSGGTCATNANTFGQWLNVTNNNFTNYPGFQVGHNNYFFNNSINLAGGGISNAIYSSGLGNNTFDYNIITRSSVGVMPFNFIYPESWNGVVQNVTSTNTIDGKPVLYYSPYFNPCPSNTQQSFGSAYGEISFVNCTNITVSNTNFYSGAMIAFTNNSLFNNFSVNNTGFGVYFFNSTNNTLENSLLYSNGYTAPIRLDWSSFNNILNNNLTGWEFGLTLYYSSNNFIENNTISNQYIGLGFSNSNNNYIDNVTILGPYPTTNGFTASFNNTVANSYIYSKLSVTSSNVTFVNTTFSPGFNLTLGGFSNYTQLNTSIPNFNFTDSLSSALIQWFLNVYTSYRGRVVAGASVNVSNDSSNLVYQTTTSQSGYSGWVVLSEMLLMNNSNYTFTPYTVNASTLTGLFGENSTNLNSSQVLNVYLNLVTSPLLEVTSITGSPSKSLYGLNENVSLSVSVYNSAGNSLQGVLNVTTYNNTFSCPFSVDSLSSVTVPCGWIVLNSSKTVVTASVQEPPGSIQRYSNASQSFYAYSTSNIVVPDSSVLIIIVLAFTLFFVFRNKLKKRH
jgi:parallel beta-helix repeat protein